MEIQLDSRDRALIGAKPEPRKRENWSSRRNIERRRLYLEDKKENRKEHCH
jgi:hypothetical protein